MTSGFIVFLFARASAVQDADVGHPGGRLGGEPGHPRVDVDGDHRRPLRRHQRRHRPGPRADLQHHVVGADVRRLDDQVVDVQVDQEVLPVPVLRARPPAWRTGTGGRTGSGGAGMGGAFGERELNRG